jgi:predicted deacylase
MGEGHGGAVTELTVGTCTVEPGEVGFGKLYLETLPDGGEAFIPLIVVNGKYDGPVLWLGAAIHGCEVPGIEVIRRVTREVVDPSALRGAIIGATVLNPYALRHRLSEAPADPVNLNAQVPGDPAGTTSQRAAHIILQEGIAHCDYAIDFHAATPIGMEFMCLLACEDPEIMARSLEIALAFGFPLVELTRDMFGYDRSLVGWAQDSGKPGFVCEVKARDRYVRSSIPHGVRGVLNVMKCIGMIDGEVEPQHELVGAGGTYRLVDFKANKSGLISFQVTAGQRVACGDLIGTVRDVWGNKLDEVLSPTDGYIRSVIDQQATYAGQVVGAILEPHPKEALWTQVYRSRYPRWGG